MQDGVLYKVTKIKLQRYKEPSGELGPYMAAHKKVDYRTNKNAVTLAMKAAREGNDHADRYHANHPDSWPSRYEVHVEVCQLPTFIEYSEVEGKTSKETLANIIKHIII